MVDEVNPPAQPLRIAGLRLGVAQAGIRKEGRDDLLVIDAGAGSSIAALFTRNQFCAAPVIVAREHLRLGAPRYLLVNSGNANAGTGEPGLADARTSCAAVAAATGCSPHEVLPFSTGVIGEPMPMERLGAAIPAAVADLREDNWERAARAIMTTDTVPKLRCAAGRLSDGRPFQVVGIAKGAGMIRPDMATMLAYIATDAAVERDLLQQCLSQATERSFNRITIDGDTSTNDACVLIATGAAGGAALRAPDDPGFTALSDAVHRVCTELAQAIVRDGEGATKFVTLHVEGGADESECLAVAYAIAHSPLVKTAFFASDPNWGRLLAAVGRAGVRDLDIRKVGIWISDVCVASSGARDPGYTEAAGAAAMAKKDIDVRIVLGRGEASATVWTCDLSYDYVRINAEYRS